ncbi:twin-arginine translocase TatA/TatE family subunit [Sphingomonas abietis]|uniref:Sec-independent protein translocase protein TatA n=1 Tax=Sphingomonas abietis TaxID=3012344 RepID=A0ABY7NKH0_9SPHN|nr:twin-arginine translocase TatA/TatE family subunit [Sphingomonas abietis]WBO22030.1 twin-arginine translocase TatA/TatE family subunit [Sphingomonas abietis]
MGLSPIHIIILALVAVLVLGGGRFSALMGDVAKGVKQFKKGMNEDDSASTSSSDRPAPPRLKAQPSMEPNADRDLQPMREDRPAE